MRLCFNAITLHGCKAVLKNDDAICPKCQRTLLPTDVARYDAGSEVAGYPITGVVGVGS